MTKLKKLFVCVLAFVVLAFACLTPAIAAFADYDAPVAVVDETETDPDISHNENGMDELVARFIAFLKDKYGEDYGQYYNLIIEQWGSVEEYLLSLGERLPEEYRTGWDKFVGWLSEYSAVWAPALAVALVIIVACIGKKQFNKIVERVVNGKLSPIVQELNLQSDATVSIMRAQRALMGNSERFAKEVQELEQSEKELKNE